MHTQQNPFSDRICAVFSSLDDSSLSFDDFVDMCSVFSDAAPKFVKVDFAFKIYGRYGIHTYITYTPICRAWYPIVDHLLIYLSHFFLLSDVESRGLITEADLRSIIERLTALNRLTDEEEIKLIDKVFEGWPNDFNH